MIKALDEVLRQFLIQELPIKNGEVEISFDQPKREWSARLNRPTINLFLHDVRENTKLRQFDWQRQQNGDGKKATLQRTPVRLDLHYLITVWATEAEDEHRLLTRTLMALFRYDNVPQTLLPPIFENQPVAIPIKVAQYDEMRNPSDLWSALDNELRPSVNCMLTLAINPFELIDAPLVTTRELRIGPSSDPVWETLDADRRAAQREQQAESKEITAVDVINDQPDIFWTIGGIIHTKQPLEQLRLVLVERGDEITLQPEGRFSIGNLKSGSYTLEISSKGKKPKRHTITVPSPDYELHV